MRGVCVGVRASERGRGLFTRALGDGLKRLGEGDPTVLSADSLSGIRPPVQ